MALTGLRSQRFFDDKNRAFWLLQSLGWGGYFVLRALGGLANAMGLVFVLPALLATATGYSLTLLMAVIYRRMIRAKPLWLWSVSIFTLAVASGAFSVIEVWAHATFYEPGWRPKGVEFLGAILLDLSVLGAWSSLYFGINYYLILSHQSERMLKLESQASSAQLAMLRYQLNPHFLFNTLNSISTLVLLKQTERANVMLSRLASFLRYTLIGEPTAQVTLAQEVESLKLYLEIEKMRFEDRLRSRFEIEPRAEAGRLPSLLLQPLVENSVKYAVTPQEEGAEIVVEARVAVDRLIITVSDTGPGASMTVSAAGMALPTGGGTLATAAALTDAMEQPISSTGVGLANTRDRLAQAYGPDHRFEMKNNVSGGTDVVIEIPYHIQTPKDPTS